MNEQPENGSVSQGMVKKFMYINRRAPHGSNYAQEGLEAALIGAAFEQDVSIAFIDDGVFLLKSAQDPEPIGVKNFAATYRALGDYEVKKVFVERESLQQRGLTVEDLIPLTYEDEADNGAKKSMLQVVDKDTLANIIEQQDVLLNF